MSIEFKHGELIAQCSDELIEKISCFATVFYITDSDESVIKTCGSGTFISSKEKRYILTASHVIDYLHQQEIIGISLGNSALTYDIETKYLNFYSRRSDSYTQEGPDLGLIEIPQRYWGAIEARKSFYNIDVHREEALSQFCERELGAWVVMGFPEEHTDSYQEDNTRITACLGQLYLCVVDSDQILGENDLYTFELAGSTHPQGISNYGGISGGGVWHIIVAMNQDQLRIHRVLLKGVVFYQLEDRGESRSVVAHGPISMYEFVQECERAH